jgi:hypothetical protein
VVDKSSCLCCQMGHYCWHLRLLHCLFPRGLSPCTEKNEKGIGASRVSQGMPIRPCFARIGINSPSGSSLADNAHNLNHLLRMMCPSTVCKTAMQCTAMHLRLQVCLTPFLREIGHLLTFRVQPTTPTAIKSQHILHQKAPQRLIPPRVMQRSHLPALLLHHIPEKAQAAKGLW